MGNQMNCGCTFNTPDEEAAIDTVREQRGIRWPTREMPQTTMLDDGIILVRGYLKRLNKANTPEANWTVRYICAARGGASCA